MCDGTSLVKSQCISYILVNQSFCGYYWGFLVGMSYKSVKKLSLVYFRKYVSFYATKKVFIVRKRLKEKDAPKNSKAKMWI